MTEQVGVRELKNRLSHYLRLAAAGERISVTDRGKEIALLIPPSERSDQDARLWRLVERGVIRWSGRHPGPLPPLVDIDGKPLSETVLEVRG
jgi:prevent-host-death family protein